jgi:SAM-dependent methyltransferase
VFISRASRAGERCHARSSESCRAECCFSPNSASTATLGAIAAESPDCALCGSSRSRPVLDELVDSRYGTPGEWRIVRCAECGLAYISPRPDRDSIDVYYPSTVEEHQGGTHQFVDAECDIAAALKPTPGVVLDVGCASGAFLAGMAARGWKVYGVEPSRRAAEIANTVATVHHGTIGTADFGVGAFDVVTLWSVLEHVHDPVDVLRRVRSMLADDGFVIIGIPNFGSLERRLFGRHFFGLDVPRHLYHFDPHTIEAGLRKAGLTVRSIEHASGHDSLVATLRSALGRSARHANSGEPSTPSLDAPRSVLEHFRGRIVHCATAGADRARLGSQLLVVAQVT